MSNRTVRDSQGAVLPMWEFLSGESIVPNGANSVANLPDTAEIFHIAAEGGDVYYSYSPIASATSPGYVPENQRVIEGPIRDLPTLGLSVFAAAGVTAHIQYYRENRGR